MNPPTIRVVQPVADDLVRYIDEPATDRSCMAVALRAALYLCDEEGRHAVDMLGRLERRPDADRVSVGVQLGKIEMANRVIRAITDQLANLEGPT